jgi:hypothetical protein
MSNIDYGKIIKRSWEVTWNNKWLWVVGLVLAAFGAGSGGGSGGSGSGGSNIPVSSPSPAPSAANFSGQVTQILGETVNYIKDWFLSIPVGSWVLLIVVFVLFLIFTTAVIWVLTSWAKGALIAGFEDADNGKTVNLKSVSPYGLAKFKDLITFRLISAGILMGMILSIFLIIGLGALIKIFIPVLGIIWIVLFGIVGFLSLAVGILLFTMLGIYAERLIVLKNYSAWNAWKKGLSMSKGNFLPTVVMGIINSVIGCITGCVGLIVLLLIFALPAILIIYPSIKNGLHLPTIWQIAGLIILVILMISMNLLIRAVFVVFDYGNWNQLFKGLYMEDKK